MSPTTPAQAKRFSTRRKALLGLVLTALAVVAWLSYIGAAGISGIATKDMDWDGDGTVTRTEIMQSFHAVTATRERQDNRECTTYRWHRSGEVIRLDCRTVFDEQ